MFKTACLIASAASISALRLNHGAVGTNTCGPAHDEACTGLETTPAPHHDETATPNTAPTAPHDTTAPDGSVTGEAAAVLTAPHDTTAPVHGDDVHWADGDIPCLADVKEEDAHHVEAVFDVHDLDHSGFIDEAEADDMIKRLEEHFDTDF